MFFVMKFKKFATEDWLKVRVTELKLWKGHFGAFAGESTDDGFGYGR
jgi:hypothetical protein